jgi:two-component system CheB/CheR fusion protein
MTLGAVRRCARLDQVQAFAETMDETLAQAIQISRSLAMDLSPPALKEGGLCAGLKWLAAHMHKTNDVTLHLDLEEQAEPDTDHTRILLFESARELVLNALKHAGVSEVRIMLKKNREHGLEMAVADEGRGFDPDILENRVSEEATFGLFHIRERLIHIGGRVSIASAPDAGTCVTLTCPLPDG